jgi:membrane protease YdiL (CAAX protease family)
MTAAATELRRSDAPALALALLLSAVVLAYGNIIALVDGATRGGPLAYGDLALAAAMCAVLLAAGLNWRDLGFGRDRCFRNGALGLGGGGALGAAPIAFILIVPAVTGDAITTEGSGDLTTTEVLYRALIAIPIATALPEEIIFRGALFGAWLQARGIAVAVVASSAIFSLWHGVISFNTVVDAGVVSHPALVGLGYAITLAGLFVGGVIFAWLRIRTGSIIAPICIHWSVNATMLTALWLSQ